MRVISLVAAALVGTAVADTAIFVGTSTTDNLTPDNGFGDSERFETVTVDGQEVCTPGLYVGRNKEPTCLHEIEDQALTRIGSSNTCNEGTDVTFNAIGYNIADHFMYAVTDHESTNTHHLIRLSNEACVEYVADLGPLDANNSGKHIAGDVYNNQLWASSASHFRAVGPLTGGGDISVTDWKFTTCTKMNDFAFVSSQFSAASGSAVPVGTAFGFDIAEQKFCSFTSIANGSINPAPQLLDNFGVAPYIGQDGPAKIGGFLMDKDGGVFMYDNIANVLYKFSGLADVVNPAKPSITELTFDWEMPFTAFGDRDDIDHDNVDGVSCVEAKDPFECPSLDKRCCPE